MRDDDVVFGKIEDSRFVRVFELWEFLRDIENENI
jgi:hypothetical protein